MQQEPREIMNIVLQKLGNVENRAETTIKRVARKLEKQGIMVQGRAKQGHKAPRSKRAEVYKVGLASQRVKDLLKTADGKRHIYAVIETGERIDLQV